MFKKKMFSHCIYSPGPCKNHLSARKAIYSCLELFLVEIANSKNVHNHSHNVLNFYNTKINTLLGKYSISHIMDCFSDWKVWNINNVSFSFVVWSFTNPTQLRVRQKIFQLDFCTSVFREIYIVINYMSKNFC